MPAIRVPESTLQVIRELAVDGSMQDVVVRAVELYRRQQLLEKAGRAFAALRRDPKAWAQEQAERDEWDGTIGDGLDEEG